VKRSALAVVESVAREARPSARALDPLRARLACAGGSSREAVLADLLEDDLDEADAALGALGAYVAVLRAELRDARAGGRRLLAVAERGEPSPAVDRLDATFSALRRRLAALALRLPG
jgi:hypothetical protein